MGGRRFRLTRCLYSKYSSLSSMEDPQSINSRAHWNLLFSCNFDKGTRECPWSLLNMLNQRGRGVENKPKATIPELAPSDAIDTERRKPCADVIVLLVVGCRFTLCTC